MALRRSHPLLATAAACGLAGCVEVPDFAEQSLIDRPRALAIIAEPPEIAPGEPSELSLFMAGDSDYSVRWSVCGAFDSSLGGGSQYGEQSSEGCAASGFAAPLGEGDRVVMPGALSEAAFDNLDLAAEILGALLPADTIDRVRNEVGLPLLVEAEVQTSEDGVERAIKRVLVSMHAPGHRNPPPPHFRFESTLGAVEIVADQEAPTRCHPVDAEFARYEAGERVDLVPIVEGEQEAWIETYTVIDGRGVTSERTEKAFYSWFVTGGKLSQGLTESPLRNERWSTPSRPGQHTLYLVVRDGHGGTAACALSVHGQ